jgi:hypothetical protein
MGAAAAVVGEAEEAATVVGVLVVEEALGAVVGVVEGMVDGVVGEAVDSEVEALGVFGGDVVDRMGFGMRGRIGVFHMLRVHAGLGFADF